MPDVSQITYDLKEITGLMLRDQGIRTGHWMIWTKFSHVITNIAPPKDEPVGPAGPGAITWLTEVGIQRVEQPGPLSVDASEVWKERKPRRARKGERTEQ